MQADRDGRWIGVCDSEDSELVPRFEGYMTFMKKGVAVEGTAALGAGVLGGFGSRTWKAVEGLLGKGRHSNSLGPEVR